MFPSSGVRLLKGRVHVGLMPTTSAQCSVPDREEEPRKSHTHCANILGLEAAWRTEPFVVMKYV